jgi:peptidoglycan-N-acetylglucosamine deacetylase
MHADGSAKMDAWLTLASWCTARCDRSRAIVITEPVSRPPSVTGVTAPAGDDATTGGDATLRRVRVWRRMEDAGPRVALSFDDGDAAAPWERILDVLRDHRVTATFFVLGMRAEQFPAQARRTVAEGHAIGSHGWDHARLPGIGEHGVRRRLRADTDVWSRLTGASPAPYLRPPYGDLDRTVRLVAAREGFTEIVLWDVDPLDWTLPGASEIARRVAGAVRPGSIVDLHVTDQTAAALPEILRRLSEPRLTCVSVPALLGDAAHLAGAILGTLGERTLPEARDARGVDP